MVSEQPGPVRILHFAPPPLLDISQVNGTPWENPACDTSAPDWASRVVQGKRFDGSDTHKFEWVSVLNPDAEQDDEVGLTGTAINPKDSGWDLPFTHPFGNDFEFTIATDLRYAGLLGASNKDPGNATYADDWTAAGGPASGIPGLMPVEIDGALVPADYRVEQGDRVGVYGRWIVDAAHDDFHTEIHPPLLMALARSVDDNGNPVTRSESATTLFRLWSRPHQSGQLFTDGGDSGLSLQTYLGNIATTPGSVIATPPVFAKPFQGAHLVAFTVRPPVPVSPPPPGLPTVTQLECSYHFTVNGGCGVEVTASPAEPGCVLVVLALSSAGYPALPAPPRHKISISIDQLLAEAQKEGFSLDWVQRLGVWIKNKQYGDVGLYVCGPPPTSQTQDAVNVVPFTPVAKLPGSSVATDPGQPFPVYGWLKLRWVTPATAGAGL